MASYMSSKADHRYTAGNTQRAGLSYSPAAEEEARHGRCESALKKYEDGVWRWGLTEAHLQGGEVSEAEYEAMAAAFRPAAASARGVISAKCFKKAARR